VTRALARLLVVLPVACLFVAGFRAAPVVAADGLDMSARALLDGHARAGSWVAVAVDLANDGPAIVGELRMAAGTSGKTRYAVPVDLPTQSDKRYVIHAQAPAFGGRLTVALVGTDGQSIAEQTVEVTLHDATQLVVGIVAERPQQLAAGLRLLPGPTGTGAAVINLTPADLPDRIEAWSVLDRLVWQDVDTDQLSTEQLTALEGWVAAGGRLVIAGGTAGPDVVSAFPDTFLPYRPIVTQDVPATALADLLGGVPADAADVPGLAGELVRGRALARLGDQVVAAEMPYGIGAVTLVGVDPTTGWLATATGTDALWRRLLPARASGSAAIAATDDSQLINAVSQLPSLALPPIGGLLLLLVGYVVLVGPVNYLVLRRLDRREWAWITIPALILGFTVGSYAIGAALRGGDLIVNQVAIVRGAPGSSTGLGLVYAGVFSPSRGTYQLSVPGGALLSAPINGDFFGGASTGSSALDIVQGDPARVRDLAIGFGSLRTIRAEAAIAAPAITADLRLEGDVLTGTITNRSDMTLDKPAVVLGGNVQTFESLAPGGSVTVRLQLVAQQFGNPLSDKVVGQASFDGTSVNQDYQRLSARRAVVDQLTYDPNFGTSSTLPADGPVLLAWSDRPALAFDIEQQQPRLTSTVLYQVPLPLAISGDVVFRNDLIRSTVVAVDAPFFSKDPFTLSFGQGALTMAYRPIAFEGTLDPTRLVLAMNQGGDPSVGGGEPTEIEPTGPAVPIEPCTTGNCPNLSADFLPEAEILDRTTSTWMALPHLNAGVPFGVRDPARYVDPDSGTVWIRFQNARQDGVGFSFGVRIEGSVR
jgi:hypothetical protein